MNRWVKPLAAVLLLPLVLTACLFLPGKFESTLTIHADRSFTFAYKGEVVAADLEGAMGKTLSGMGESKDGGSEESNEPEEKPDPKKAAEEKAKKEAEYREVAVQLAKEAGYRSVEYRGEGLFYVDYEISGVLTHNFVYPFDMDTQMIFPWLAIELRGKDVVRVKAPGFAKQDNSVNGMPMASGEDKLDGTFTLVTDAEVVSQNEESGGTAAGGMRTFKWRVNARTDDPPMAVLKVKGL
ncbi:hypothetical protein [Sphingomonas sp.]|uniref:hypothetical protein n=1 Tax=Sphingomonas sp. TaxID=28214 RepID=UPI001B170E29|nr:hypothetical protein [Sphingomonas sp.]MBO9714992.1 hypothetical protein [Sphingomonas sp.]